jgi:predicted deacylase
MNLQPNYIHVEHDGEEASLVHYCLGQGERRALIIAGVHGSEHGGIQAAYELMLQLDNLPLRGQIDFLPVCNPMAYSAETRLTPGSESDMARSFTQNQSTNITETISRAITDMAEKVEFVLNLHSAGDARYLPHVIFYREQDVERVASMGFPFAIKRGTPETLACHILSSLRPEQFTVTIELGGGICAFVEDVTQGVDLILAYLGRNGFLESGDYERKPTPQELVWLVDDRQYARAPSEGGFYSHATLGADFICGEPFGFWVDLEDLSPRQVVAPVTGKLIYIRTRNRVPQGETLGIFLSPR